MRVSCIASRANLFCAALAWLACERAWSVCVCVSCWWCGVACIVVHFFSISASGSKSRVQPRASLRSLLLRSRLSPTTIDKIRLLGFTTLHDSRRYTIPRCLGPSYLLSLSYLYLSSYPNARWLARYYRPREVFVVEDCLNRDPRRPPWAWGVALNRSGAWCSGRPVSRAILRLRPCPTDDSHHFCV